MPELISEKEFDEIIINCVKYYRTSYADRSESNRLITRAAGQLLGVSADTHSEPYEGLILLAHLNHYDLYIGIDQIAKKSNNTLKKERFEPDILENGKLLYSLTGWRQAAFLPLLVRFLLFLYIQTVYQIEDDKLPINKKCIINVLKNELWIATNAFRIKSCYENIYFEKERDGSKLELLITSYINALKTDEYKNKGQICFPFGQYGHAIYLQFIWFMDRYLLRIDNVGAGSEDHTQNEEGTLIRAYTLGCIDLAREEQLLDLKKYLMTVCFLNYEQTLSNEDKSSAVMKIYNNRPVRKLGLTDELKKFPWPELPKQEGEICVVENYKIGMYYRMYGFGYNNKEGDLFAWIMKKLTKYNPANIGLPPLNNFEELVEFQKKKMGFDLPSEHPKEVFSLSDFIPANRLTSEQLISISKFGEIVPHYQERKIIQRLEGSFNNSRIIAVTGIAGSGKTQLVTCYIQEYRRMFPSFISRKIRANTVDYLNEDLRCFAFDIYAANNKTMNLKEERDIRTFIQSWLTFADGFLLFFDNVTNIDLVHDFIHLLNTNSKRLIITSQDREILKDDKMKFPINGLTEDEAYELIKDICQNREQALNLAKKFSMLPLGLMCAKLFIETNSDLFTPEKYLEELEKEISRNDIEIQEDILISQFYQNQKDGFRSQLAACRLAISKLDSDTISIINFCSFLAPDTNIPQKLLLTFIEFKNTPLTKLTQYLGNLEKYSLVIRDKAQKILSIHSVVQNSARSLLKNKAYEQLSDVLICLNKEFNYRDYDSNNTTVAMSILLIPHVLAIVDDQNLDKQSAVLQLERDKLITILCLFYLFEYRNYETVLKRLNRFKIDILPIAYQVIIYNCLAYANLMNANEKECVSYSLLSLELSETKYNKAFALCMIGHVFYENKRYNDAIKIYEGADKLIKDITSIYTVVLLNCLGKTYFLTRDYGQSRRSYESALDTTDKLSLSEDHPEKIHTRQGEADLLFIDNNQAAGLERYQLVIRRKISLYCTKYHPEIASTYRQLAERLYGVKNFSEAKKYFQESIEIRKKVLNTAIHGDFLDALEGLKRTMEALNEDTLTICKTISDIHNKENLSTTLLFYENSGKELDKTIDKIKPYIETSARTTVYLCENK